MNDILVHSVVLCFKFINNNVLSSPKFIMRLTSFGG